MPLVRDQYTGRIVHVRPGDPRGHWPKQPGSSSATGSNGVPFMSPNKRIHRAQVGTITAAATVAQFGGLGAPPVTGTGTNVNDTTGSYFSMATGAIIGLDAGWALVQNLVCLDNLPDSIWIIKTGGTVPGDVQDVRIWVALTDNTPNFNNNDNPAGRHIIGFRFSTGTDTNWTAVTKDGATINTVDTGVPVAADTRYEMRAVVVTTSQVDFYINGTKVATLTTNLPGATTGLGYIVNLETKVATSKNIRVALFNIESL